MASQADLLIYQGDDYVADITVMEEDGVTPADLTGCTAQSQIRVNLSDTTPNGIAQFAVVITLPNTITIVLTHDITKTFDRSSYVWDIQVIDANGWITTILAGNVAVPKEVTRIYVPGAQMVGRADLMIYQGDDYGAVVTVAPVNGGPPTNLTGYLPQAQIRSGPADTSPVVAEIAASVTLPDKINLGLNKAVTTTLAGNYMWDLQVTDPIGAVTTLLSGNVIVTSEITREP